MTIKIVGYSVGDKEFGIGSVEFSIDTGMEDLSEEDKEFLIKGMVRDMWELHDNGPIRFNFSDEDEGYARIMDYQISMNVIKNKILKALD